MSTRVTDLLINKFLKKNQMKLLTSENSKRLEKRACS